MVLEAQLKQTDTFTDDEMEQVLDGFRARGLTTNCLRHSAMITFQIHLVAGGDIVQKL